MQHPDWQGTFVQAARLLNAALVRHHSVTAPTSHDGADDQHESDKPCHGRRDDRYTAGA
jgi:hypothetical protein